MKWGTSRYLIREVSRELLWLPMLPLPAVAAAVLSVDVARTMRLPVRCFCRLCCYRGLLLVLWSPSPSTSNGGCRFRRCACC